jgi:tetratricopeptide (TPR) repeat protein
MGKITTEWYNYDLYDADVALEFYKKHQLYYENLNNAIDKMTIEEFIVVKQRYCEALEKMNRYNEALTLLKQIYKLLDRLKNKKSKYYDTFYEKALFCEGLLLGRQEKYKESNEIFKKLIFVDPENERYENWYLTNKEWLANKKISIYEYFVITLFVIIILWGNNLFADNIFIVRLLVFVLFVVLIVLKRFYRKFIKLPKPEIQQNNKTNA